MKLNKRFWALVDMETGDVWVHKSRRKHPNKREVTFTQADDKALELVELAIGFRSKE